MHCIFKTLQIYLQFELNISSIYTTIQLCTRAWNNYNRAEILVLNEEKHLSIVLKPFPEGFQENMVGKSGE